MASQFNKGHEIPVSKQEFPGKEHKMPVPKPTRDQLPEADGTTTYQSAGKLEGKKALITGGDSGIGAATAVLFARDGADSTIAYLPEEEKDARETKSQVEELGAKCHLIATDLKVRENCRKVVDFALEKMGAITFCSITLRIKTWWKTLQTCRKISGCTPSMSTCTRTFTWPSTLCGT
ncbi:hypothetical protein RJ55_06813 [Drechmeria coniospora]|nr:hypothetical protein RJ55_06813 [Drechmeria coniospora]